MRLVLRHPERRLPHARDARLVEDALWAHSATNWQVEHITVRPADGYLVVIVFYRSPLEAAAPNRPQDYRSGYVTSVVSRVPGWLADDDG